MRFVKQVRVLARKNVQLQLRNKMATATQLFIGVFFLVLLLLMDLAVQSASQRDQTSTYAEEPNLVPAHAFVPCRAGAVAPCYDLVYSSFEANATEAAVQNEERVMEEVVQLIGSSADRVLRLASREAANDWLLDNPNRTLALVHFENAEAWGQSADFAYVLRLNETRHCAALGAWGCNDPIREVAIPLQTALDAAFMTVFDTDADAPKARINVTFSDFPHPDLPSGFNVVQAYGPTFLYIAVSFNYVIQLTLIVEEKELHLVEAMKQMGMLPSAYWTSWIVVNCVVNTLMVALLVVFGVIFQLEFFVETAGGLVVSFFWLSSMSFTAMAMLFSTLTRTSSSARLLGIGIFILTFIACPLLVQFILQDSSTSNDTMRSVLSLLPVFSFYHVLTLMIAESAGVTNTGMTWADRVKNVLPPDPDTPGEDGFWSVEDSLLSMVYGFFLLTLLAWYLEHVIPNEHGHSEPLWFFLKPSYWTGRRGGNAPTRRASSGKYPPAADDADCDEDVRKEAEALRAGDFGDREIAVKVHNLVKRFEAGRCSGLGFLAVRGIEYAIEKDTTFVLLGHNGAGKSTTISMLTGLADVTDGDAEIFGHSVVNDMKAIQSVMGVCPQHDVLWGMLSGREHLELFASMKGVPDSERAAEVDKRLRQTLLLDSADRPAWTYSGGMKRRLSIAIALIGDPMIVFLDEPTTGMDPLTRREVWDMIAEAKKGRVIFLTTHSMEEADILGDRIAIMSKGRIQAIGSSLRLKARYGSGYQMNIMLEDTTAKAGDASVQAVQAFLDKHAPPDTKPLTAGLGGVLAVELPRVDDASVLGNFFRDFEAQQKELGVHDYAISQSTLENVFINLSAKDHFIEPAKSPGPDGQEQGGGGGGGRAAAVVPEPQDGDTEVFVERDTGTAVQFKALLIKSLRYQLAQRTSCCSIVAFPLVIMAMLLLVETAVFQTQRFESVCGKFATKDNCSEFGANLECYADLFAQTVPQAPGLEVGAINNAGRYGGINPNCDKDGCYVGLEQPRFSEVPLHLHGPEGASLGSLNLHAADADRVREWYQDLGFLSSSTACRDTYQRAFDSDILCEGKRTKPERDACEKDAEALLAAATYLDQQQAANSSSSGAALSYKTPADCAAFTPVAGKPPQAKLDYVEALQTELQSCEQAKQEAVVRHFLPDASGWQIADAIAQEASERSKSGVLGQYTSTLFPDRVTDAVDALWMQVLAAQAQSGGGMRMPPGSASAQALCAAPPGRGVLNAALRASLLPDADADTAARAVENMCAFAANVDVLRGVSFDDAFTSGEDLRVRGYLERWGGLELQTEHMEAAASTLEKGSKYRARVFLAHAQGYEFSVADTEARRFAYTSFFNNSGTGNTKHGNWPATVWAMNNAIVRAHTGFGISMRVEPLPRSFTCNREKWLTGEVKRLECDLLPAALSLSILDFIAISLFPYLLMIHMFIVVGLVVYEKENRLRMIMKMMGLSMRVYWLVNYLFYFAQYMLMVGMMSVVGTAANIQIFTLHDSSIVFLFLFTWGNLLVVFSFLLSVFFKSSRTSTAAVFLFMLIINTTGANLIDTLTSDPNTPESAFTPMMIFPPLVMIRALFWLGLAGAFGEPITMDNLSTYGNGVFAHCLKLMWVQFFLVAALVWYLDNVTAVGYGVPRHPLFFLSKSYWLGAGDAADEAAGQGVSIDKLRAVPQPAVAQNEEFPEDVKAEYERATRAPADGEGVPAIRIVRLHKEFQAKLAVRSVSLAVNERECFALLGHNGAGKTTTLSMLTGLFQPTSGAALVDGFSIKSEMSRIYQRMGVCPQHDVIWAPISGRDHLRFYGRLKGLRGAALEGAVRQALQDVNLTYAASRPAGKYSGGMKRRLSTAIAIIGNPRVVYLDEPSTGLDPASRRQLWDVISRAKGNKSIILTTHSMEEADLLADRLGVMANGLFQCIGVSADLKKRFGIGFTCSVTTRDRSEASSAQVLAFVKENFPTAQLRNEPLGGTSTFEIGREDVVLSKVFRLFEDARESLGIVDWAISETTLEEVFLALAKASHAKTQE